MIFDTNIDLFLFFLLIVVIPLIMFFTTIDFKISALSSLIILSSATSTSFWLDNRIMLGQFPISVPDLVLFLYGINSMFFWLTKSKKINANQRYKVKDVIKMSLIIWFVYNSILGISLGYATGNETYAILQEYRVVLYTFIGYICTLATFKIEKHLSVVIHSCIWAGILVCIWQLAILVLGISVKSQDEIAFITAGSIGRSLRDVNLPLYFAPAAMVILNVVRIENPSYLGKIKPYSWILTLAFLTVPILSLTRTIWVAEVFSVLLLLIYYTIYYHKSMKQYKIVFKIFYFFLLLILFYFILVNYYPNLFNSLEMVFKQSFSLNDSTYIDRESGPLKLIEYFFSHDLLFFYGLGFGNIGARGSILGVFTSLHNVYLSYLVFSGILGFILFLKIWFTPFFIYFRLLALQIPALIRAYIIASIINLFVLSLIIYTMPTHWAESAYLGMSLAIVTLLSRKYSLNEKQQLILGTDFD